MTRRKIPRLLLLGLSLSLLAVPAYAEEAAEEDELSLVDLMAFDLKVVTASRKAQDIRKAPAILHVILEEEIRARGYQDLKDVFRDVPGFDVSEEVSGEVRTLAIARGILGANKLMVLQDGKRLNAITGERLMMGNNMPIRDAKRIEIMYGPGSVLYGADAYAGIVNIITKSVKDLEKEGKHAIANFSYGTQGEIDGSVFGGMQFTEQLAADVRVRWYQSDGHDPREHPAFGEGYTLDSYSQPGQNYNILARGYIGDFKLTVRHADAREAGGPSTLPAIFAFTDEYIWHEIQTKAYAEHTFEGEDWTLKSTIGYERYEIGKETNFNYAPATMIGSQYKYGRNESFYLEEQFFMDITEDTQLIAGLYAETVNAFPKGNNLSEPYNRADLVDTIVYPEAMELLPQFNNQEVTFGVQPYQGLGLYTEVAHEFFDMLTINAGVRADYNTDFDWVATPRFGAILIPNDETVLKVLYGHAYIRPSRYLAFEHWSAGVFGYQPNPDLQPETLQSVQGMGSYTWGPLKAEVSVYYNAVKDLIRPRTGVAWNQNVNSGEFDTFGGDLKVDFIWEGIRAYAYYSYLNATQVNGNAMNKVAPHKVSVGGQYTWKFLTLSTRLRWSDKIPILTGNGGSEVKNIDGHFLVDASLRARDILDIFDAYVSVRNLTDSKHAGASPFGEGPEQWLSESAPQPGINGEAGIRVAF